MSHTPGGEWKFEGNKLAIKIPECLLAFSVHTPWQLNLACASGIPDACAPLARRCVSGTRVVAPGKTQSVGGVAFRNYGSHVEEPFPHTYMTAAAALGTTREDVDELVVRLDKCFTEFKKKCGGV